MTSLLTAIPKYWWGKCPTCPTTDYLPGLGIHLMLDRDYVRLEWGQFEIFLDIETTGG